LFSGFGQFHPTSSEGFFLQRRRLTVEDKDGPDSVKEELANSVKETEEMSVWNGIAGSITESLHGLIQPDGNV
jgi:hypothetical protein